jgi:hypothetical protein
MVILPDEVPCNSEYTFTPLIKTWKNLAFSCAFQKNITTTTTTTTTISATATATATTAAEDDNGDDDNADNNNNSLKLDAGACGITIGWGEVPGRKSLWQW